MVYFFITRIGDEVAGYVRAVEEGAGTIRITMSRLAVQWQHTSVPTSLLRNVHDFCCHRGFSTVLLDLGAVPPLVMRLLEHNGFHSTGIREQTERRAVKYEVSVPEAHAIASQEKRFEPIPV